MIKRSRPYFGTSRLPRRHLVFPDFADRGNVSATGATKGYLSATGTTEGELTATGATNFSTIATERR